MPTSDESKILKMIEAEGGECTVGRIAIKMRRDPNYVRIILRSMGENDIKGLRWFKEIFRRPCQVEDFLKITFLPVPCPSRQTGESKRRTNDET